MSLYFVQVLGTHPLPLILVPWRGEFDKTLPAFLFCFPWDFFFFLLNRNLDGAAVGWKWIFSHLFWGREGDQFPPWLAGLFTKALRGKVPRGKPPRAGLWGPGGGAQPRTFPPSATSSKLRFLPHTKFNPWAALPFPLQSRIQISWGP